MNIFSRQVPIGKARIKVPSDMAWCFTQNTFYERNVIYWLEKVLAKRRDHVFYDVGGNIGFYTVLTAQQASHVYAFEPVKNTFKTLSRNVRNNRFANVEVFQVGLSDEKCVRNIHVYSSSGNNSLYRREIPPEHSLKWLRTEQIQLERADDFVEERRLFLPTIIKVDVEGAELPVLLGARQLIARARPVLIVELSENTFRDAGYGCTDLLDELRHHDYLIFGLAENVEDLTLHPVGSRTVPIANVVAFPDDSLLPAGIRDAGRHA